MDVLAILKQIDEEYNISLIEPRIPYLQGSFSRSTKINDNYLDMLNYVWENHSNSYSLLSKYYTLKKYEKKYKFTSQDLYKKWSEGTLKYRDTYINDWLTTYLQIKNFIND